MSHPQTTPKNLNELLSAIRSGHYTEREMTSLPTFGGTEPDHTHGVWSWDERSLLVGTCADDMQIVPRPDITCLFAAPDGLCSVRTVHASDLAPTSATTVIRGWGALDGDAVLCIGPAQGDYLVPRTRKRSKR